MSPFFTQVIYFHSDLQCDPVSRKVVSRVDLSPAPVDGGVTCTVTSNSFQPMVELDLIKSGVQRALWQYGRIHMVMEYAWDV